jgi:hypothetical protein
MTAPMATARPTRVKNENTVRSLVALLETAHTDDRKVNRAEMRTMNTRAVVLSGNIFIARFYKVDVTLRLLFPADFGDEHDSADSDSQSHEGQESKHCSITSGVARKGTGRRQQTKQGCDDYHGTDGDVADYFHRTISRPSSVSPWPTVAASGRCRENSTASIGKTGEFLRAQKEVLCGEKSGAQESKIFTTEGHRGSTEDHRVH